MWHIINLYFGSTAWKKAFEMQLFCFSYHSYFSVCPPFYLPNFVTSIILFLCVLRLYMKVKSYHHRYHWKIYCDDNSSLSSIILINLFASLCPVWSVIFLLFFLSCFLLILFSLLLLFLSFLSFFLKKTLRNIYCVFKTWRKRWWLIFHQQTQMPRKLRYWRCAYGRVRDSQSPELYMNTWAINQLCELLIKILAAK